MNGIIIINCGKICKTIVTIISYSKLNMNKVIIIYYMNAELQWGCTCVCLGGLVKQTGLCTLGVYCPLASSRLMKVL